MHTCVFVRVMWVNIEIVELECVMGWLRLLGSIKLNVSFTKEPYKRDYVLQMRPIIFSIRLSEATP